MNSTKLMTLAFAIVGVLFISITANAQTGTTVTFKGLEVSAGSPEIKETYGWMCYAKTSGFLPGSLTLSMNYEGVPGPDVPVAITSGAWTIPVYYPSFRGMTYAGVVYGKILAGEVVVDKTGTVATVTLKLLITGGTQDFAGLAGTAMLEGTVDYNEKPTTFAGKITFHF